MAAVCITVINGSVTITNSTLAGNSAGEGGGVYSYVGHPYPCPQPCLGQHSTGLQRDIPSFFFTLNADNLNLFGHSQLTNAQAFSKYFTAGASDITATSDGTTPTPLADILAPLADNGGPTQTHALVSGSPAIDAAGATCSATDQRGIARPQPANGNCDIGAFELEAQAAGMDIP